MFSHKWVPHCHLLNCALIGANLIPAHFISTNYVNLSKTCLKSSTSIENITEIMATTQQGDAVVKWCCCFFWANSHLAKLALLVKLATAGSEQGKFTMQCVVRWDVHRFRATKCRNWINSWWGNHPLSQWHSRMDDIVGGDHTMRLPLHIHSRVYCLSLLWKHSCVRPKICKVRTERWSNHG